ncbi:MAG: hypothetical protein AB7U92_13120 [Piscinibacter sp.]|uniref:hypothetical protein n=1 Tax=Piscinibacter sp. TaxID=1903157 RepID=UPI003D114EA3
MTTLPFARPAGPLLTPARWLHESLQRQRALTLFGLAMLAAMLPLLALHGLDDRTLRGVGVWVKPLKFLASTGVFALTTAWFVGLLPPARRHDAVVRVVVATLIGTASFENAYITWQAALGEASHYNFADRFHVAMYQLMGAAAVLLTLTQPLLAWHIVRHARADIEPLWRRAVVLGLVLTFALGAGAGAMLGPIQPPAGSGLPLLGWHALGDLRPAHFLGLHAQQLVPLIGLALLRLPRERATRLFALAIVLYVAAWAVAMVLGLQGAVLRPPVLPPA